MTKHIVVIDDEDDLLTVIKAALVKYAGWQVSTAATTAIRMNFLMIQCFTGSKRCLQHSFCLWNP